MNKEALITIKNLSRGYPEAAEKIFEHFNFTLHKGDFHILMGASGTGKTTLTKIIIGELPISHNCCFYGDDDISKFSEIDMENYRKSIGIVFQEYRLFDQASVKENIGFPLKIYGLGETIIESKVDTMITKLHLRKIMDTPVHFLSAGEKQKVCLARALVHDPAFIIADEPTGNLDRDHTKSVGDMLIEANKSGNTIFLVTHDAHLVHYLQGKHTVHVDILQ